MKKMMMLLLVASLMCMMMFSSFAFAEESKSTTTDIDMMQQSIAKTEKFVKAKMDEMGLVAYKKALDALKSGDGIAALNHFRVYERCCEAQGDEELSVEDLTIKRAACVASALEWVQRAEDAAAKENMGDAIERLGFSKNDLRDVRMIDERISASEASDAMPQ